MKLYKWSQSTIWQFTAFYVYTRPGHSLQVSSHQLPSGHRRYINISQLYLRFLFFPSQSTYTVNLTRTSMLLNDTQTHMYNVCAGRYSITWDIRYLPSLHYIRGDFQYLNVVKSCIWSLYIERWISTLTVNC